MALLQALKSFQTGRTLVRKGQVLHSSDPAVVGREQLFRLLEDDAPVETATAVPGEKRNVRRAKPVEVDAPAESVEE